HISRTLGGYRVAFIGAWLKIVSYTGAEAFLAGALADYLIEFSGGLLHSETHRLPLALGGLLFFYLVHVVGVRWFCRLQVTMCALLGVSLLVLVAPGLFAIHLSNYQPFVTHGFGGFAASLLPIFFSYAGFEALAQTAGEVQDSTNRLPRVFLFGITATAGGFFFLLAGSFGVVPGARLQARHGALSAGGSVYLMFGGGQFSTFCARF